MARCANRGAIIISGGKKLGDLRFCGDSCYQRGAVSRAAVQIPDHVLRKAVNEVHMGMCPKCQGRGPLDAYTSYTVWSALFVTRYGQSTAILCRACGVKEMRAAIASSLLLGWWGFPFGLIMTPVQIGRNIKRLSSTPSHLRPSPELESVVRMNLASQALQSLHADEAGPGQAPGA